LPGWFFIDTDYLVCEVGTEFLCIIYLSLQREKCFSAAISLSRLVQCKVLYLHSKDAGSSTGWGHWLY